MFVPIVSTSAASSTGNDVTTGAIDTSGADLLVAYVAGYSGTTDPIPGVTDNFSNTWVPELASLANPTTVQVQGFYAKNPIVGAGHTFSAGGTQTFAAIAVLAASGSDLSAPFDGLNAGNNGGGSTTVQGGTVGPSQDGSLIVSGGVLVDTGFEAISVNQGFTLDQVIPTNGGFNQGVFDSYLVQGTAAAVNPTTTFDNAGRSAVLNMVFKPAASVSALSRLTLMGAG